MNDIKSDRLELADLIEKGIKQGIPHDSNQWVGVLGACSLGTAWLVKRNVQFSGHIGLYSTDLYEEFPVLNTELDDGDYLEYISVLDAAEGREAVIAWLRSDP